MASIRTDGTIWRKRRKEELEEGIEGGRGRRREKVEEGLLKGDDIDVRME